MRLSIDAIPETSTYSSTASENSRIPAGQSQPLCPQSHFSARRPQRSRCAFYPLSAEHFTAESTLSYPINSRTRRSRCCILPPRPHSSYAASSSSPLPTLLQCSSTQQTMMLDPIAKPTSCPSSRGPSFTTSFDSADPPASTCPFVSPGSPLTFRQTSHHRRQARRTIACIFWKTPRLVRSSQWVDFT